MSSLGGRREPLTDNEKETLIHLYKTGLSLRSAGRVIGRSAKACETALIQKGIERRKRGEKRYYNLDENFFGEIDTERKAYWLGFICADGHINRDGHRLTLRLKGDDSDHLKIFLKDIGSNSPLRFQKSFRRGKCDVSCVIELNSRTLVKDLKSYGLDCKKSEDLKIPNNLLRACEKDFWRGMIDGDGGIYKIKGYWRITLVGTWDAVKSFSNYCQSIGTKTQGSLGRKTNSRIFYCSFGAQEDVLLILNTLWKNFSVSLKRKRKIAQKATRELTCRCPSRDHSLGNPRGQASFRGEL